MVSAFWLVRSARPIPEPSTSTPAKSATPAAHSTQFQPQEPLLSKPPQVPSAASTDKAAAENTAAGPFWLRGRVVTPENVPVEAFEIQLYKIYEPFLTPLYTQQITNRAGEFEISSSLAGPLDLVVRAKGFIRYVAPQSELALSREDAEPALLIMVPEGKIRGQVVDDSEKPVSGVLVKLGIALELTEQEPAGDTDDAAALPEMESNPTNVTDAQGRFELSQLPQGNFNLYAELEGYFPAVAPVLLKAGQTLENVRLMLSKRGAVLTVRVVDAFGAGVAGRAVQLEQTPYSGVTDASGSWRQGDLPPGNYRILLAASHADGRVSAASQWADKVLDAGKEAEVVFNVENGITINGEVLRGEAGMPQVKVIAGQARGELSGDSKVSGAYASGSAETDERGQFVIEGLPPGDYALAALIHDEPAGEVRVSLRTGDRYRRIQIQLGKATLEGSVTDEASGKAVVGAVVNLFSETPNWDAHDEGDTYPVLVTLESSADRQGKYRFEGLSEGNYLLDVSAPQYGSLLDTPVKVEQANNHWDVQLQRSSQLIVRVHDAAQLPVHGATFMMTQTARPDSIRASATNADGLVHLNDLAPGSYEAVLVLSNAAAAAERTLLTLAPGQIARWNITLPVQVAPRQATAEAAAPQ